MRLEVLCIDQLIEESFANIGDEVRYHKDIGFPPDLTLPRGFNPVLDLKYGSHAREEAMAEKYGILQLPRRIDIRKTEIFEVATRRGSNIIQKICVRMAHDDKKDIVIVIMVPQGFVKTVWANLKTDTHRTLNRANYTDPNAVQRQPRVHQRHQRRA